MRFRHKKAQGTLEDDRLDAALLCLLCLLWRSLFSDFRGEPLHRLGCNQLSHAVEWRCSRCSAMMDLKWKSPHDDVAVLD